MIPKNGTIVLNTPLVVITKTESSFEMLITCKDGSVVEHEPFPPNLEGMVSAISLAAEICAGKFFLKKVFAVAKQKVQIEARK